MKTIEEVLNIAIQFSTKTDWHNKSRVSYDAAIKLGIFDQCIAHMLVKVPWNKKWTKELITLESQKYSNVSAWKKESSPSYKAAYRLGILSELTTSMLRLRNPAGYWDKDTVLLNAKKYHSRTEWDNASSGAVDAARTHEWHKEACQHMEYITEPGKWNNTEDILIEAKKYKSKSEWRQMSYQSYAIALTSAHWEQCIEHMDVLCVDWTEEKILNAVKSCINISEFVQKHPGAYVAAKRLNLLDQAKALLPPSIAQSSVPERNILQFVQLHFPKAQKIRFGQNKKGTSGARFELDIYIPELRKGIEFNGTYWHGKGFKRTWTSDPSEYHQVKRDFFKTRNIEYLEIEEKDWNIDKAACISQIAQFLNIPNL